MDFLIHGYSTDLEKLVNPPVDGVKLVRCLASISYKSWVCSWLVLPVKFFSIENCYIVSNTRVTRVPVITRWKFVVQLATTIQTVEILRSCAEFLRSKKFFLPFFLSFSSEYVGSINQFRNRTRRYA